MFFLTSLCTYLYMKSVDVMGMGKMNEEKGGTWKDIRDHE